MMEIGNNKAKYAIQVHTKTYASKWVGTLYCDTEEEYNRLLDDHCDEIYDQGHIGVNISNDFEVGDVEIDEIEFEKDKQYHLNKTD